MLISGLHALCLHTDRGKKHNTFKFRLKISNMFGYQQPED
jgi:hypothetical protein